MALDRLYWFPGTCARVPLVALEELGEPFEVELVNRLDRAYDLAGFHRLNPKGKVPTLQSGELVLTENPAIQTFLARRHPNAGLLPADAEIAALETISWFAAGVHPHITRLRFPRAVTADPTAFDAIGDVAREELARAFAILEKRLGDGRDWLFGRWSLVDVHMLWLWFRATGSGFAGNPFPRCAQHARRTEQRPSVARALAREDAAWEAIVESGVVPPAWPPHQTGHTPPIASH